MRKTDFLTKKSAAEGIETEKNTVDYADRTSLKRMRKDVDIDESIENKWKKSRKGLDMTGETVDFVDHTTQLPETVIHHILSLLPSKKDVACTSILSKRWRRMWISYSGLEISDYKLSKHIRGRTFKEFAHEYIQNHFKQIPTIRKLKLHIFSYDSELASHMDKWIGLAVQNKIAELDLCIRVEKKAHYCLPGAVLASKSITALRLSGCKWKDIKLTNLKRLCLRKLNIHDHNIENIIFSCPLIEDMRFVKCSGLRNLQVSRPELHRVEVHHCHGLKKIELVASNLHTFLHSGKKSMLCNIMLNTCKSLKVLTLEDYRVTDTLFETQFSDFPVLEKLELSRCNVLRNIKISGKHLKKLVLRECGRLDTVKFDTPNLVSFEYKGDKMIFSSLDSSSLKEAKLCIFEKNEDNMISSYRKLRKFLSDVNFSEGLKLVVRSNANVVIHEDLTEILLPAVNGLTIEILKASTNLEELCDSVLEQWQPQYLSIVSPPSSKFSSVAYDRIHNRDEHPSCCRYKTNNRCWRHYLDHVDNLEISEWISWIQTVRPEVQQMTAFELSWSSPRNSGVPKLNLLTYLDS